ncbi:hypothetical protein GPJ56_009752 [Histomonas meleagridis]|uniref:uncharacterized protein n=1 Tax=Histomonas meleagridis TaxID=135588 RepID=UPI00355A6CA3|nr:hypothetical protein GPJ56_009752 [Histomonas meleagridis]KAH0802314.1 hypothetical protein GO595_004927 [Histomonas meleagridis]
MIPLVSIFLVTSLSYDMDSSPQSIRGGAYDWAYGLGAMRGAWKSFHFDSISFNDKDINLKPLLTTYADQIASAINITQLLQDLSKQLSGTDSDTSSNKTQEMETVEQIGTEPVSYSDICQNPQGNIKLFCSLFGSINPYDIGYTEESFNELLGSVFSSVVVVTMLVVFFIISLLYFISGLCIACCCCPKESTKPNIISIIFYIAGAAAMLFGAIFMTVGYCMPREFINNAPEIPDIVKETYDNFYDLTTSLETVIPKYISPDVNSIDNGLTLFFNNATNIFDALMFTVDTVLNYITGAEGAFALAEKLEQEIIVFNNLYSEIVLNVYNRCNGGSEGQNIPIAEELEKYNPAILFNETMSVFIDQKNKYTEVIEDIEGYKHIPSNLTDAIRPIIDDLESIVLNPNFTFKTTFSDMSKEWDTNGEKRKSFNENFLPITDYFKFYWILIVIFVLLFAWIAIWTASFFTKCCCSRCNGCCPCFPQCLCNFFLLIFGAVASVLCYVIVVVANTFVNDTDYSINYLYDQLIPNRELTIPSINLSSTTEGLINEITFDTIEFPKSEIKILDTLFNAETTTSILNAFSLDQLIPFQQIAQSLQGGLTEAIEQLKVPQVLDDLIDQAVTLINDESILPSTFSTFIGEDSYTSAISAAKSGISGFITSNDGTQCGVTTAEKQKLNSQLDTFSTILKQIETLYNLGVSYVHTNLTSKLRITPSELIDSVKPFLTTASTSLTSMISNVSLMLSDVSARSIIGPLNVIRSSILVPVAGLVTYFSIGAHLYMIGLFICALLLMIRHRGMKPGSDSYYSSTSTSSYSTTYVSSANCSFSSSSEMKTIDVNSIRNSARPNSNINGYGMDNNETTNDKTFSEDEYSISVGNDNNNEVMASYNPPVSNYSEQNPYQDFAPDINQDNFNPYELQDSDSDI